MQALMSNRVTDSSGGGDCKGKNITSAKYSIGSDGTCVLPGTGNQNNVNPLLTYLADNGGSTKTHLPEMGSPAINGVSGSDCPSVATRSFN